MTTQVIQISAADLAELARAAAERAVRKARDEEFEKVARTTVIRVLQELGLADHEGKTADAGYDLRDLRNLIQLLRLVKRRIVVACVFIAIAICSPFIVAWGRHLL